MLDEDCKHLRELRATLEREQSAWGDEFAAQCRARNINRCINEDEGGEHPLHFSIANQNIVAMALLLRAMLEPSIS